MIDIVQNKEVEGAVAKGQSVTDYQQDNSFLCLQQFEQIEFNVGCRCGANNVNDGESDHG